MMVMYQAINTVNNKRYIGISSHSLKYRMNGHIGSMKRGGKTYFLNALRKYGKENFKWEILGYYEDYEDLKDAEIAYIKYCKVWLKINLYNLTNGGDGVRGMKFSKEHKHKISEARKKQGATFKGKHHSEITKIKIAKANLGKIHSDDHRNKISNSMKGRIPWNKGKTLSEEHKNKLSKSIKNKWNELKRK